MDYSRRTIPRGLPDCVTLCGRIPLRHMYRLMRTHREFVMAFVVNSDEVDTDGHILAEGDIISIGDTKIRVESATKVT